MAKFDHDMPRGEISPPQNGACYWQNGNSFDAQFNHVNMETGAIIERAEGQKAPPLKTKETPAEKRERQQASIRAARAAKGAKAPKREAGAADAPATPQADGGKPANVVGEEDVDLAAWAAGRAHTGILFGLVKKQMEKEGYEKVPLSAAEARKMIKAKN